MSEPTYRVLGVRADGSETVLVTGMTLEAAKDTQADPVVKGDYASLRIEPDAPPPVQSNKTTEDSSGR